MGSTDLDVPDGGEGGVGAEPVALQRRQRGEGGGGRVQRGHWSADP